MNRIDVHNHFLPGQDDGCRNLAESLTCLRMMVAAGYSRLFCTPHTGANEFHDPTTVEIADAVTVFQTQIKEAGIPIAIKPGGELRLSKQLPARMRQMGIPTYGHAGIYVVADLWEPDWPDWATRGIEWLLKQSMTVILAHPERMTVLRKKPDFIDELARMGLRFQGNLGPIAGGDSADVVALSHRYLQDGRYFMLGTDGHRPDTLPIRLEGLKTVQQLVGVEKLVELTETNPGKLWE
jgi:protein-tyrosine phosphatase